MTSEVALDYGTARRRGRFYYGWVVLVVAAAAMVCTFPGRSLGRGLITEPLLADLRLSRVTLGWITLVATLVGSLFSLACGPLVDRLGTRVVLTLNGLLLGAAVLAMSRVQSAAALAVTLTLTLGLGQSALSAVSLSVVGKWFVRRIDLAMAVYAAIVSIAFFAAFGGIEVAVRLHGWRDAWAGIGWALVLGLAPLAWLLVRRTPESVGLVVDGIENDDGVSSAGCLSPSPGTPGEGRGEGLLSVTPHDALTPALTRSTGRGGAPSVIPGVAGYDAVTGATLREALRTPAFWVFAVSAAAFNLIFTGVTTFAEAIVREQRYYDQTTFLRAGMTLAAGGLVANFAGGYFARKVPHGRLMALGMLTVAAALLVLPLGRSSTALFTYALLMGLAGGVVTVVFFGCWTKAFGRAHLGKIQGAAQVMTVLASALGPVLLALGERRSGSISATFLWMAPAVAALAVACWFVPVPVADRKP
jgi:MFS family permease